MRVHGLRVHVKRDPAIRVPQELLYGVHIFPVCLQQSAEVVAESVPNDVLGNVGSACHRLDIPLHEIVRPIGLFALHARTGKDPVTFHRVRARTPPAQKIFRHVLVHRDRLG
jgi:hypothetical protein